MRAWPAATRRTDRARRRSSAPAEASTSWAKLRAIAWISFCSLVRVKSIAISAVSSLLVHCARLTRRAPAPSPRTKIRRRPRAEPGQGHAPGHDLQARPTGSRAPCAAPPTAPRRRHHAEPQLTDPRPSARRQHSPPRRLVLGLGREDSWRRSAVPGRRSTGPSKTHTCHERTKPCRPVHVSDTLHQGSTAAATATRVQHESRCSRRLEAAAVRRAATRRRPRASHGRTSPARQARRCPHGAADGTQAPRDAGVGTLAQRPKFSLRTFRQGRLRNTMVNVCRSIVNAPTADPVSGKRRFPARREAADKQNVIDARGCAWALCSPSAHLHCSTSAGDYLGHATVCGRRWPVKS